MVKKTERKTQKTPQKGAKPIKKAAPGKKGAGKGKAQGVDNLPRPHIEEAVATRLLRDTYTRERHYFLMRLILCLSAVLSISIGANIYLATKPVEYRYFATDTEGRIRPLTALDQPIQSMNEILNWTTNAITQTYTFSFANYRQELQAARIHFTPQGWQGFERALQESRTIQTVLNNRFVTTAVPVGAPVVVAEGLANGRYAWRIQLRITVTYQSAQSSRSQSLLVTATVVRRPETENPRGLGIAQIIAE